MKKYRCPNCKEVFVGAQENCPKCGVILRYSMKKKENRPVEEDAVSVSNFVFSDPDVIKHEGKFVPVTALDSPDNPDDAVAASLLGAQRTVAQGESFFDGKALARVGVFILAFLLFVITAGLGLPWAYCKVVRWDCKHTTVSGHRLKFTGKGIQLFGRYLLWILLTPLTAGIILLWVQVFVKKWKIAHIEFLD